MLDKPAMHMIVKLFRILSVPLAVYKALRFFFFSSLLFNIEQFSQGANR